MRKSDKIPSIYLSYAWNSQSESIAEAIEKEFHKKGVRIIRDKNDLGYKGRIKEFMEQIGRGKYVILIISNKYLRSENCMFELLQIFKNQDFYERIFPVVLDEVKISKATDRLELVKYWENETKNLNDKIRELEELSNLQGVTEDLNLYTEIRGNIANLTNILKDINSLNADRHMSSDFGQLYGLVKQRIATDLGGNPGKLRVGKTIKQGVIALVGIAVLVLIFSVFNRGTSSNGNNNKDIGPGQASKDSLLIVAETAESKTEKEKISEEKISTEVSEKTYDVELVVPSYMSNGVVLVDNEPAEIIDRNLIFIKVRLKKKNSSHRFEIKNASDSCATDKLISQNNVQVALCD